MASKAKHAFGTLEGIDNALSAGVIDAYDILFVKNSDGKPYVGWIDKSGNKVIVDDSEELAALEAQIVTKANADEVDEKLNQVALDSVASANAYTDQAIEAINVDSSAKKYDVSHKPENTLVDYREKEIRIMCPADTKWVLQQSGAGSEANKYYIGVKAYASSNNVVSFKEDIAEAISDETMYYFENNEFAGIEDSGRKYSIIWLPVAVYDSVNDTWTYYGSNSSSEKFVGWYYSVEWYDADGVIVATDCIRINLSNESCHSSIEPYYVNSVLEAANAYADTQIEAKIAEASAIEIIEF